MTQNAAAPVNSLAPSETREHFAGLWHFALIQTAQAGYRIQTRHAGVIVSDKCRAFRTETEALRFWAEIVDCYAAPCERTAVKLQYVTVTLAQLETGVWRVETVQGSALDAWSRSYAERDVAVGEFARVAAAFRRHGTVEGIDRRWNELASAYAVEIDRMKRRMHSVTKMRALSVELEALADLNVPTGTAALAAA